MPERAYPTAAPKGSSDPFDLKENVTWFSIVGRVENNQAQIYINGESVAEGGVGAVTFSNVGIADLYDCPDGFNYKFDGRIDEVAIFKKALTEDDIENIMTNGLGQVFGLAAVSSSGKLTTTWGQIKNHE